MPDAYHADQGSLLTETLEVLGDHFSAVDLNVYFDETHTGHHKRPDWFLALGVGRTYKRDLRRSYVVWKEEANPFLIVELVSDSTIKEDYGMTISEPDKPPNKWEAYERYLKAPYYVVYDYIDPCLTVYHLMNGKYRRLERPLEGRVFFPKINLVLKEWYGTYRGQTTFWLRWFRTDDTMVPTNEERATQERAEKLRERAEKERLLVEKERLLVEKEHERAEKERLLTLLRQAGIDPYGK